MTYSVLRFRRELFFSTARGGEAGERRRGFSDCVFRRVGICIVAAAAAAAAVLQLGLQVLRERPGRICIGRFRLLFRKFCKRYTWL